MSFCSGWYEVCIFLGLWWHMMEGHCYTWMICRIELIIGAVMPLLLEVEMKNKERTTLMFYLCWWTTPWLLGITIRNTSHHITSRWDFLNTVCYFNIRLKNFQIPIQGYTSYKLHLEVKQLKFTVSSLYYILERSFCPAI